LQCVATSLQGVAVRCSMLQHLTVPRRKHAYPYSIPSSQTAPCCCREKAILRSQLAAEFTVQNDLELFFENCYAAIANCLALLSWACCVVE